MAGGKKPSSLAQKTNIYDEDIAMSAPYRVALITGCSSGLGEALARECLDQGYHVIATARRPEHISLDHPHLHKRALDLNDAEHLAAMSQQIVEEFGELALLINNAGYGFIGPLLEVDPGKLAAQLQTNSIAPLELVQNLLPMLKRGSTVVNIGSVSAHLVTPFAGSYCASKAALHALSDALRLELAPFGIRVMVVRAGAIRSRFADRAETELQTPNAQSPYASLSDAIAERARLSQKSASDASEVARDILAAAQRDNCPAYIGVAKGNRMLYRLSKLPAELRDRILSRRFGLSRLSGDELRR